MRDSINTERSSGKKRRSCFFLRLVGFAALAGSANAGAQGSMSPNVFSFGAQAIGVATRESPALRDSDLTEGYLTQPMLMLTLSPWGEALCLKNTINFEGATIQRGELNAGIYGEGYIDRRHPHTYLHELVLTSARRFGGDSPSGVSFTVGKGFAPFGTDDPMARPFEKYPINHHLAQILERAVAIGALRAGSWIFEAGAFNGDFMTLSCRQLQGLQFLQSLTHIVNVTLEDLQHVSVALPVQTLAWRE